ncbi:cysteine desulfurase family protein [Methylacidimicrobium sp. B4]|uniref:cysteine desulfurase family protein n=1 Tax=Methylacidimicrobium sp. B4 TaxID=2796139 RepID=UPI001A8DA67D|nr:aminotransferase class V-fold PLP-dependent enzyme [Methylacidimicrobium sp. B4]QSR84333.1 aminotransferase class V-fold PLP-dependent enzyme [Methylacidimicrobium sp. B4]
MSRRAIYLDHNATTAVLPEVAREMVPFLSVYYGNPSSAYSLGQESKQALRSARRRVARLLGGREEEILFTGGGTESDNTALWSALRTSGKRELVTTLVEHPAIYRLCQELEKDGYRVRWIPVGADGRLDPAEVARAIGSETAVVSVMTANNETGVLFPIREVSEICRAHGVLFHTDAVQATAKVPVDVSEIPVDFLSVSAHKFGGPKGVGALYVRDGVPFRPFLWGGSQERGRRAGTENVAAIVGMGRAAELAAERVEQYGARVGKLRDRFEQAILSGLVDVRINGHPTERVPNTSNLCFANIESEALLLELDRQGIQASGGSACSTGSAKPSRVLVAMGLSPREAFASVRFSLGWNQTEEEIDLAAAAVIEAVCRIREKLPASVLTR